MYVINEKTKVVNVWEDNEVNRQRLATGNYRVVEYFGEVEKAYNGVLYAKGFAPKKSVEDLCKEKRDERNVLLEDSDKKMLPDYPISEEEKQHWINYRQYLRDVTQHEDFPKVNVLSFEEWKGA